jgi:hypothetical protein
MIQQRAAALAALIKRQQELGSQLHLLEGFRRQGEAVQKAGDRLAPLLAVWGLFNRRGIGGVSVPTDVSSLLADLEQLRLRFNADATYVLGANRLTAVRSHLPAFADRLEQSLLLAWRAHAAAQAPRVNPEVLMVLSNIGALRSQVSRITAGLHDLDDRVNRLPSNEEELDQFGRRAAEVGAAWNELDSEHLPPEVLVFLRDAGGVGAELANLTELVRSWLQEHGLTAAFRIRQTTT